MPAIAEDLSKVPPHSRDVERMALSCMFQQEDLITRFKGEGMTEEAFYVPAHKVFFKQICVNIENGLELDLVEFIQRLDDANQLEAVGGHAGVTEIAYFATSTRSFSQHLATLREKQAKRRAQRACESLNYDLATLTPEEITHRLTNAQEEVATLSRSTRSSKDAEQACGLFSENFEELRTTKKGQVPGIRTGCALLDQETAGTKGGELWTIAGKTSAGKSVLMLQLAAEALSQGLRVLVISLEMSAVEIVPRLIANLESVRMDAMVNPYPAEPTREHPEITERELASIRTGLETLRGKRIVIEDDPGLNIDAIESAAKLHNDEEKLDMVVIDYLQRIDSPHRKGESRSDELGRYARRLKTLAGVLGCPVLTASQLNDDGQLFASRIIGHESNVVLSIGKDHVELSKNRNGPRGHKLPLVLNGPFQRFEQATFTPTTQRS